VKRASWFAGSRHATITKPPILTRSAFRLTMPSRPITQLVLPRPRRRASICRRTAWPTASSCAGRSEINFHGKADWASGMHLVLIN